MRIEDVRKKAGISTSYEVLSFFYKKGLMNIFDKYVTGLSPLNPKWKQQRITKIGRKYIYFIRGGKELKEVYVI